jgi:hypothetical protein
MTGSERDVLVEERTYRTLNDSRAAAAHAKYIEAQLRYRPIRDLLARLRHSPASLWWCLRRCFPPASAKTTPRRKQ